MLPYIADQVGLPIACQPYPLDDADMAVFLLPAGRSELAALLDTYLNQPSQGMYDYRLLLPDNKPLVTMIMAQMTAQCNDLQGQPWGQDRYSELSFWIPCYDHNALLRGEFRPALFLPYLFPDSFTAVTTGREMFGFRKQQASFHYPAGKLDVYHPQFCSKVQAFRSLGLNSQASDCELLKLENGGGDIPAAIWDDLEGAAAQLVETFIGKQWFCGETGQLLGDIANDFLAHCPAVFIKQFPDISNAAAAESRSITSTTFSLKRFKGAFPWLADGKLKTQELQFARLASHPLAANLGLQISHSAAEFDTVPATGFWCKVDFALETGKTQLAVNPPKQKIAVLGGGIGSLASVYALTKEPGWQQKYDITLYQMGWRLGGKGASGRNPEIGDRIEEHGLHIWLGYYDNAFRVMQDCYAELARPANSPLATWDAAFKKHSTIVLEEYFGGRWHHWPLQFRPNQEVPGQGEAHSDHPARFFTQLRGLLDNLHTELSQHIDKQQGVQQQLLTRCQQASHDSPLHQLLGKLLAPVGQAVELGTEHLLGKLLDRLASHKAVFPSAEDDAIKLLSALSGESVQHWLDVLAELRDLLEQMLAPFGEVIDTIRRMLTMLDISLAIAKGVLSDGVLLHGYQAINQYDFTEWLIRHGASQAAANSAPIRAFYDLCLAFPNGQNVIAPGDVGIGGNVSAGELLHAYILVSLCYKGAVMWKMQAGMGDTVMTPLYQLLKQRGVKFEFFHKVSNLGVAADGKTISHIDIDVQATLKPGLACYNPLYDVKGLPCWPSVPLYAQLQQGQQLKAEGIDLESSWSPWQPVARKRLQLGTDFDRVVLGISVAALHDITPELAAANPRWRDMLTHSNTSQSMAMQLWLNVNLEETGWNSASPVLDGYAEPFNTWAAMDQTLDKENWPLSAQPFGIAYFCNNLKQVDPIPPYSDHGYPAREKARVREMAGQWLKQYAGHLWPFATQADGKALDWNVLVDLDEQAGEARLDSQYFRANVEPTERYVCNAAGTNQFRLKAGDTGFANLLIAGDWIDNGSLNMGCVESTVISGLQAAAAISGVSCQIKR